MVIFIGFSEQGSLSFSPGKNRIQASEAPFRGLPGTSRQALGNFIRLREMCESNSFPLRGQVFNIKGDAQEQPALIVFTQSKRTLRNLCVYIYVYIYIHILSKTFKVCFHMVLSYARGSWRFKVASLVANLVAVAVRYGNVGGSFSGNEELVASLMAECDGKNEGNRIWVAKGVATLHGKN